jgi:tetratricopeptide (TPR) repeat protein
MYRDFLDPNFIPGSTPEQVRDSRSDLLERAAALYGEALAVATDAGLLRGQHRMARHLARILGLQGRTEEAVEAYNRAIETHEDALDLVETLEEATCRIDPRDASGRLREEYDEVREWEGGSHSQLVYERATALLARLGHLHWQGEEYDEAAACFARLVEWIREWGDEFEEAERDLARMLRMLAKARGPDDAAAAAGVFARALVLAVGHESVGRLLDAVVEGTGGGGPFRVRSFFAVVAELSDTCGLEELAEAVRERVGLQAG